MLVISRKENQIIQIGNDIVVMVCDVHGDSVKLGIVAPKTINIGRPDAVKQEPKNA